MSRIHCALAISLLVLALPRSAAADPPAFNASQPDAMFRLDAEPCGFPSPAPHVLLETPLGRETRSIVVVR